MIVNMISLIVICFSVKLCTSILILLDMYNNFFLCFLKNLFLPSLLALAIKDAFYWLLDLFYWFMTNHRAIAAT